MTLGLTMTEFLENTKSATETIINSINELNNQTVLLDHIDSMSKYFYQQKAILRSHENENEYIKSLAEKMVNLGKDRSEQRKEIIRNVSINGSVEYLAQSILQISRHGIISVHGKKANCKQNVSLWNVESTSQDIVEVIWEGRNQSIHFEDPSKFRNPVKNCFNDLKSHNPVFSLYDKKRNMAYEIINLLAWTGESGYKKYEETMLRLS